MVLLILTLTANPAIDQNFTADRLAFDDRAYVQERSEAPGGRGINASTVLHSLGVETLAIAPCGGASGERFRELLGDCGFSIELVPIRQEIRTNRSITDRQGLTVKIDEKGPELEPDEIRALEETVLRRLGDADWLMLCGSLPPGVPSDFYKQLIEEARKQDVRTHLDVGGTPLLDGLDARPTIVAPNQTEAEQLSDRALIMRRHFHEAADHIRRMGAETVVLSLGSRGAVLAHEGGVTEVIPPRIDAVCPIGAGDALNAAVLWATKNGSDMQDAVRWGVAAGTASARLPGLGFANLEQIREVYAEVEVRPVE
jgi:1-phosphofructokinase family hexose kinase